MIDDSTFRVDADAGFRVELRPGVATVVLDRPERLNCQDPKTWDALASFRRRLSGDVRVVVLRGAGRAFSAGLDRALFSRPDDDGLLAMARLPQDDADARIARWQQAFDWSSTPGVVSIAAVQGHAIGAGFQLALGADIRIVADDAQFAMAEPSLGIVPDLGGTKRLVDLVGYSRAVEICLTGRRIGADEALRIGLASHAVPLAELDAAVRDTTERLLAVDRDAAAETKALLLGAGTRDHAAQRSAERAAQYRRLRTLAGLDAED